MNKNILPVLVFAVIVFGSYAGAQEENLAQNDTFIYNDGGKRDPFWPLVSVNGSIITYDEQDLSASDMMLTGIMAGSNGKNLAMINGKIIEEGGMIGAFHVVKITSTFVVLDNGREKTELHLRKEN